MDNFFLREHLIGHQYSWANGATNPVLGGEPSRRFFDRFNGYHVLNIINSFGRSIGKLTLQDGRKLEALIVKQLPEDLKSELAVFNWLRGVYLYHWSGV
jgi:hypothetical protein